MEYPIEDVLALYPALKKVLPAAHKAGAIPGPVTVADGAQLFREDDPCKGFPLVLDGAVRVSRRSGDGRSVELYSVVPGELCLASSACLFRSRPIAAHGVAVGATTLLMISSSTFNAWLADADFRDFVLGVFAQRLSDLSALVDAVAFQKLDRRLAAALLGHGNELSVTHQDLADALGTVREIVTRLLHGFARQGWIGLSRECIRIHDGPALRRFAAGR